MSYKLTKINFCPGRGKTSKMRRSSYPAIGTAVTLWLWLVCPSEPYSMGAPDLACKKMQPGHGFDPQEGQPPVELIIEPEMEEIAPGQKMTIKLKATDGQFKGFMIQVKFR